MVANFCGAIFFLSGYNIFECDFCSNYNIKLRFICTVLCVNIFFVTLHIFYTSLILFTCIYSLLYLSFEVVKIISNPALSIWLKNLVLDFSKHKYVNSSTNRLVNSQGILIFIYTEFVKGSNGMFHSDFSN